MQAPQSTSVTVAASQQLNRRLDAEREAQIDRAIAIQASSNTMCAVEYLKSHQFTAPVIMRILFQHDARRAR